MAKCQQTRGVEVMGSVLSPQSSETYIKLKGHLLQPPPLLLLLLNAFLPLRKQLALVFLLLPELLLLEELLATECLRSLLVFLLQTDEVAA